MRRSWCYGLPLALALVSGCSATSASYQAPDGTTTILASEQRTDAVEVRGTDLDGKPIDTAGWRGSVVVVNFWGSWCYPCRAESTSLEQAYLEFRPDGVQFLGVATRDTAANANAFRRTFPQSYPSLVDENNAAVLAFRGALPVASVPTTYVLDRNGRIAARALGEVDLPRLRGLIQPILDESK